MNRRLRILWISHFVPYPPKGGCFQRSYNLIKRVGAEHDVWLVALRHKAATHPAAEIANAREELLKHCREVHVIDVSGGTSGAGMVVKALGSIATLTPFNVSVYANGNARRLIRQLSARVPFDVAHFDTVGLAQYLPDVGDIATVMTHHGAESHMIRRRIAREPSPIKKAFFAFEWLTLRQYERQHCPRFDANVVMSADDGRLMRDAAPAADFTPVDNGVDTTFFTPVPRHGRRVMVFAGRLDQYSNRDGILFFVKDAWPGIRDRYPDVVFHIIGSNPPDALRELAASDSRVKVHGFVPDVRPYFQEASVAICPLRDGGGTRIKVLDALAQGIPIVATTVACEGIDVTPGTDVLIADSGPAFVEQIGRVFDDAGLRHSLASRARSLAESRYSWDSLSGKLMDVYRSVVAARLDEHSAA